MSGDTYKHVLYCPQCGNVYVVESDSKTPPKGETCDDCVFPLKLQATEVWDCNGEFVHVL